MSELCLLSTPNLCSLLLSGMVFISSFVFSHPLYLSYFIFFSPYILKLLCFLYPLFFTTALLLLGFLTLSPALIHGSPLLESPNTQFGFFQLVLKILRSNIGDEESDVHQFLELEAYRLVFDTPEICGRQDPGEVMEQLMRSEGSESCVVQSSSYEFSCVGLSEVLFANLDEKTMEIVWEEIITQPTMEEDKSEGLLKEFDKGESGSEAIDGKLGESEVEVISSDDETEHTPKVETPNDIVSNVNDTDNDGEYTSDLSESSILDLCLGTLGGSRSMRREEDEVWLPINEAEPEAVAESNPKGSEVEAIDDHETELASVAKTLSNNDSEYAKTLRSFSSITSDSSFGSYGSMRRDKEWSRTLACKLFAERHTVEGDEGMDLLWETYEKEPGSTNKGRGNATKKKNKKKKKSEDAKFYNGVDDEDEEEDGMSSGHFCCLQALKFSGGKVNLGMKRPSLVKISKAIKGIGWLHHVTRHDKRVHQ